MRILILSVARVRFLGNAVRRGGFVQMGCTNKKLLVIATYFVLTECVSMFMTTRSLQWRGETVQATRRDDNARLRQVPKRFGSKRREPREGSVFLLLR